MKPEEICYLEGHGLVSLTTKFSWYQRVVASLSIWRPRLSKVCLAVADQALMSGSNFLISILLARWLAPEQYGSYALAFAIFLLLSLSYQALLLDPMSIFGPSAYRNFFREYLGVLLWIHLGLALAILFVLGISAWVTHTLVSSASLPWALAGVTLAAPCILLFWLARSAFYVKLAPRAAAIGGLSYSALVLGGLVLLYRWGLVSPLAAFLLMALGAAVVGTLQVIYLKPTLKLREGKPSLREVIQQHWGYGRWILASNLVIWIPSNIYYVLFAGAASMAQGGELKALLNLALPVGQTATALSLLIQPYAARLQQSEGRAGVDNLTRRITQLYTGAAIFYWAFLIFLRKPVMHHLYAGNYMGVTHLVPWIALSSVLAVAAHGPGMGLRAIRSPKSVFVAFCASSVITLGVGIPATWAFGLQGTILTLIVSNGTALAIAFVLLRRKLLSSSNQ